jgi:hypothetical protein
MGVFFNQGKFDVCQLGRLGQYLRGDDNFPMSWMEPAIRLEPGIPSRGIKDNNEKHIDDSKDIRRTIHDI